MASSDRMPDPMPPGDGSVPPGKATTMGQKMIDTGAQMMQSFKPIKQMSQHACTLAAYSHDMSRQIQTHLYISRINQDFLQCAVYDSDNPDANLIGVEYIVSDRIFDTLPADEQKLWHSHAYEVKSGLWLNPGVPDMIQRRELYNIAPTYGKFWCTWQVDRGDRLPLGAPALMASPQEVNLGMVNPELIKARDDKYKVSVDELRASRMDIEVPEAENPRAADYWKKTGKGFAIDIERTQMNLKGTSPQIYP